MNWEIKRRSLGLIQEQQFTFSQRWIWNPDEFYDSMILFFHQLKNGWQKTAFHRYDRQSPGGSSRGGKVQSPATHHVWDGTDWEQDGRARLLPPASPSLYGCWSDRREEEKIRVKERKGDPIRPFMAWNLVSDPRMGNQQSDLDKESSLTFCTSYLKGRVSSVYIRKVT